MANIPVPSDGGGGGATEQQVVNYITSKWGAARAAQFKKWYAAALKKDPALTPAQGAEIWILGVGLATGIAAVAVTVTGGTAKVTDGTGQTVGSSSSVGVGRAAAGAAAKATHSLPNPLSGIDAIGAFFATLTQANTWIRILKITVGGVLLLAGIVRMTGATDKLAALGPVGMVASKVPGV